MPIDYEPFIMNLQLFAEEKTETATPHKREEVRKKGQVAKSNEIGTALLVITGFYIINSFLTYACERLSFIATHILSNATSWDGSIEGVISVFIFIVNEGLMVLLPVFGILLLVAIISQAVQVGFMFNVSNIQPKFNRINPLEGFKRIFSKRAMVEFTKSVLKICIVVGLAYWQVRRSFTWLCNLSFVDIHHSLLLISSSVYTMALIIGLILFVLAIFDYLYQRWEFEQNIKMTKHEVKEEMKQTEGDPQLRSRIRQKQREMASRRMMQAIPSADVIITNPSHFAVALLYKPDTMAAPEVIAKGTGNIAIKIKEIAKKHAVPTVENPPLARALYQSVEIGQQIPAELYPAVAEVLAFVYQLKKRSV